MIPKPNVVVSGVNLYYHLEVGEIFEHRMSNALGLANNKEIYLTGPDWRLSIKPEAVRKYIDQELRDEKLAGRLRVWRGQQRIKIWCKDVKIFYKTLNLFY